MPEPEPAADPPAGDREPLSTMDAWAEARFDLRLSDEEWLGMTPRMLRALSKRRLENMRWSELVIARLAAETVNHSFRGPKKPTMPREYMIHPWPEVVQERPPVTGEMLMAVFADQS